MGVSRIQLVTFILGLACVLSIMSVHFSTDTWLYTAGKISQSLWKLDLRNEDDTKYDVR